MALIVKDRVKQQTTTTGTGTYTLSGSFDSFQTFAEIGDGNTTYYCCTDGTDFEIGRGAFTASGTTLSRDEILSSSNSDAKVNWSAGTRTIYCTQPADRTLYLNNINQVMDTSTANATNLKVACDGSNAVLDIAGGGPNFIRFRDGSDYSIMANAIDVVYRTSPNDLKIERAENANIIAEFGGDDGHAKLLYDGSDRIETTSTGTTLGGDVTFTGDSYNVVWDKSDNALEFADNATASFGDADDLKIFHNGTHSVIRDDGTGDLRLRANNLMAQNTAGTEIYADFNHNGAVELYYDAVKKFETKSDGVDITGELQSDSLDVDGNADISGTLTMGGDIVVEDTSSSSASPYVEVVGKRSDGNDSYAFAGKLFLSVNRTDQLVDENKVLGIIGFGGNHTDGTLANTLYSSTILARSDGDFNSASDMPSRLEFYTGSTGQGKDTANVNVGTERLRITSGGDVQVKTGHLELGDSQEIRLGDSDDFTMTHNGSNTVFHEAGTGSFVLRASQHAFKNQAGTELNALFTENGAVELYYDNAKKLETTSTGVTMIAEQVTIRQTDDGNTEDPQLILQRISSTPADNDLLASILFRGENDADEVINYAKITSQIADASDGAEDGYLTIQAAEAGAANVTHARFGAGEITFFKDTTFQDNVKAKFGTGGDLQIYHDGSGSYISEQGTGLLYINSTPGGWIRVGSGDETSAYFKGNGAAELYYDNVKTFETTADGVDIISTDDGNTIGPKLHLYRDSASPADFDDIGSLYFSGNDSGGNKQEYAYIRGDIYDTTNGSEDAAIRYFANVGGTVVEHMQHAFGQTYVFGKLYLSSNSIHSNPHIQFEGSTGNNFETSLYAADPTADRTITLPDATGEVVLKDSSDVVTISSTANDGPAIKLVSDDPSDAADFTAEGRIQFFAENSASESHEFAAIKMTTADITDGTEDGRLTFNVSNDGSLFQSHQMSSGILFLMHDQHRIQWQNTRGTSLNVNLITATPTDNRTITLPDATGTVALENGNAVLLNTTTVSSGVSSVDFGSSLITDDFDNYLLVVEDLTVSANTDIRLRLGTANSVDISNLYTSNSQWRAKSLASTTNNTQNISGTLLNGNNAIIMGGSGADVSTASTASADFTIRFNNLRSTTFHKTFSGVTGSCVMTDISGANLNVDYVCSLRDLVGTYQTTSAVNFIRIYETDMSSQISGGTFSLYGLKT